MKGTRHKHFEGKAQSTKSFPFANNPHRWHQDIKPANILVFKPQGSEGSIYDSVQFKLSDLGLSHFSRHAKAHDVGGTQTYGKSKRIS